MDEIVQMVVEKTGLPEAQAEAAVNTVIEVLKDKLPDNVAGMVDMYLGGEGGSGGLGGAASMLGGLLGGNK